VRDAAGEELGRIEGVILDGSRDCIRYAVLSFGARLGANARLFAVPWSVLRLSTDGACVILDVPKERLKCVPCFDRHSWPSITDPSWREEIDSYYGVWSEHE
jgi:hypothetical protein